RSDPRKGLQGRDVSRDLPRMTLDDRLRGGMEVARAAVEAQALPGPEHILGRCLRQLLNGGEALQEALVVRGPGDHAGPLEEDLRDEDAVRISGPPPWHIPPVRVEPTKQSPSNVCGTRSVHGPHDVLQPTSRRGARPTRAAPRGHGGAR